VPLADQVRALPDLPGVYRFRDQNGRLLYVGRATSLRSRVGSYFTVLHDRRHLRRMIPQIVRVEALVLASVHEASWVERNLHYRSLPRWNRTRGDAEVPQVLELDDRPAGPRLTGGPESRSPIAGPVADGPRQPAQVSHWPIRSWHPRPSVTA